MFYIILIWFFISDFFRVFFFQNLSFHTAGLLSAWSLPSGSIRSGTRPSLAIWTSLLAARSALAAWPQVPSQAPVRFAAAMLTNCYSLNCLATTLFFIPMPSNCRDLAFFFARIWPLSPRFMWTKSFLLATFLRRVRLAKDTKIWPRFY